LAMATVRSWLSKAGRQTQLTKTPNFGATFRLGQWKSAGSARPTLGLLDLKPGDEVRKLKLGRKQIRLSPCRSEESERRLKRIQIVKPRLKRSNCCPGNRATGHVRLGICSWVVSRNGRFPQSGLFPVLTPAYFKLLVLAVVPWAVMPLPRKQRRQRLQTRTRSQSQRNSRNGQTCCRSQGENHRLRI